MTEPLDSDRWARVEALFEGALAQPVEERGTWLARECGADEGLRLEVESLLAASESGLTEGLRAVEEVVDEIMGASGSTGVGRRLGTYHLEEEIGRGGMGVVYRGVRADGEFEQTVAVKVLPGALFSPDAAARFRNERRILASLEHPNIARLLDGGATPEGVPYVIMEYVDGVTLDRHVRSEGLSVEGRIWLFLAICDAVEYAHRNLIVHRDLKPSNVLVTSGGVPKLLDFGIAKLLEPDEGGDESGGRSRRTHTRIMTPRYASPEQLEGGRIGTSTDIYSLGILLYELLAGVYPWPRAEGGAEGAHEAADQVEAVRVTEPEPPSVAGGDRRLAGDLDTIVLKALRRDVEERYQSVRAVADDLERYLTGQPIAARPPTLGYRARKFVGRNRVPVTLTAMLIMTLAGFSGAVARQAGRLAEERDAAEAARLTSDRSAEFLVELFREADPERALGEDLTARDLLARGTLRAREELAEEPEVLGSVLDMIGRVYRSLAVWDTAFVILDEARAVRFAALGPQHPDYLESLVSLGLLARSRDDFEGALAYYDEALTGNRALYGNEHERVALLLSNIGVAHGALGHAEEATRYYRESVAAWDALDVERNGGDVRNDLNARNNLATSYYRRGVLDSAVMLGEQVLERRQRLFGGDHPDVAVSHNNVGYFLMDGGHFEEARPHLEESLAMRTRIFGEMHPTTLTAVGNMGLFHARQDQPEEALPYFRRAVEAGRSAGQPRFQAERLENLSQTLIRLERWDEAEPVTEETLALAREAWGPDDPRLVQPFWNVATVAEALQRGDELEEALREAVRIRALTRGEEDSSTGALALAAGQRLRVAGRMTAAEGLIRRALRIARANDDAEREAEALAALASLGR